MSVDYAVQRSISDIQSRISSLDRRSRDEGPKPDLATVIIKALAAQFIAGRRGLGDTGPTAEEVAQRIYGKQGNGYMVAKAGTGTGPNVNGAGKFQGPSAQRINNAAQPRYSAGSGVVRFMPLRERLCEHLKIPFHIWRLCEFAVSEFSRPYPNSSPSRAPRGRIRSSPTISTRPRPAR